MGRMIELQTTRGERFEAWYAEPENVAEPARQPGLVFLAETFNLNAWARNTADAFAALGYRVVAPDLHWRAEAGVHLAYGPENRIRAMALYERLDDALAIEDAKTCLAHLQAPPNADPRCGVIGFCVGGRLALRLAAKSPEGLRLAIGYYSSDIGPHTSLGRSLEVPALFHFGATDPAIPGAIAEALADAGRDDPGLQVHVYDGAGHGFCRVGEPQFNAAAVALSRSRTLAWLASHLPLRPTDRGDSARPASHAQASFTKEWSS